MHSETDLKGYFGKGNLSPGYPSYQKKLLRAHEEKNTVDDEDGASADEVLKVKPDNANLEKSDEARAIAEGVRHRSSEQVHFENESVNEELHLLLEEAFFLSYALDCLQIFNNDEALDHCDAWFTFQKVQSKFIERYVVYHHFRTKGWVVRSGVKYGGDYVLYRDGPPFYHATYVVFIVSNDFRDINFFLACYRAAEVTKKELLICRVKVPDCSGEVPNLDCLKECQVSEYTLKRWTPSENR